MPRRGGARPFHATPPHKYHHRSATSLHHHHRATRRAAGRGEEKQAPAADPPFLPSSPRPPPPSANGKRTVSSSATSRCGFSSAVCCCCLCTVPLCSAHHQRTRSRSLSSRGEGRVGEIRSATLLFFHKLQFRHIVRFGLAVAGCLPPAFSLGSILIDRVDEQAKPSEHSCSPSVERRIRPLI